MPENGYTVVDKVTLRRLLSHSAGLEDGFTNRSVYDPFPDYVGRAGSAPTVSLRALLDADSGVDVDGPARVTMAPGSAYRYANADYAVLEILLEDITGRPFDEFMAETILDPLGMSFSTFAQPLPDELRKRASSEHNPDGEPFPGERMHFPYRAAGGLWTTPSDLARFALEVLRAYRGDPEVLLSQAMVVEMLTPQIAAPPNTLFDASGLGFHLSGEGNGMGFWHTG